MVHYGCRLHAIHTVGDGHHKPPLPMATKRKNAFSNSSAPQSHPQQYCTPLSRRTTLLAAPLESTPPFDSFLWPRAVEIRDIITLYELPLPAHACRTSSTRLDHSHLAVLCLRLQDCMTNNNNTSPTKAADLTPVFPPQQYRPSPYLI